MLEKNKNKQTNSGIAFQGGKTLCSQAMENMFIKYVEYQKKKKRQLWLCSGPTLRPTHLQVVKAVIWWELF